MSSVWYIGGASARIIDSAAWAGAGHTGRPDSSWDPSNGYSISQSAFTAGQLLLLDDDPGFVLTATDGPRPGATPEPYTQLDVSRGWVAERIAELGASLFTVYAPTDLAWLARAKLDIWPAFNAAGGTDSWAASTYPAWIAGVDSALNGHIIAGKIVKTDRGASSDPAYHIYTYSAGPANAPHALLIGGHHPNERLSQISAMRFFQQFATGSDPAMRALRQTIRITWIPTLAPSGYWVSRENSNGVNVNRNFDYLWQYYTAEPKGTAPFDQPEAALIKSLLDGENVSAVLDCHTTTMTTPNSLLFNPPSRFLAVRRDVSFSAGTLWNSVYSENSVPCEPYHMYWDTPANPVLTHWSARYLTYTLRRSNAASVTIEAPEPFAGSTMTSFTRDAIRAYCGYITLWLAEWLLNGQTPTTPRDYEWYAAKFAFDDSAALGAGGGNAGANVTPDGTYLYVGFDRRSGGADPQVIDLVAPCPGRFIVNWAGSIENGGAAGGAVSIMPYLNPKEDAAPTSQNQGLQVIEVPAGAGKRVSGGSGFMYTVTGDNVNKIHRFRLGVKRDFTTNTVYARRFFVTFRFVPHDVDGYMELPIVDGP